MTAYPNCKFCRGRGCLACDGERQRDIEQAQEPIFVARTLENIELLKEAIGSEALERAYAGSNPEHEIQLNLVVAGIKQALRQRQETNND